MPDFSRRHRQPIQMGEPPVPGYYLCRLVRNGPWVGAQIVQHEDGQWSCHVDGEWQGPSADPWLLPLMEKAMLGKPSTEGDVKYRIGLKRWAAIYSPSHPSTNPKKPIDPGDLPTVF
jgi:hypothetical protein